jgi:hypothetical protein
VTEWRSNIGSTGLASLQSLFDSNELNTEERQQLSSTLKQDDSWIYGTNPNTVRNQNVFSYAIADCLADL